jgi:hypothetical protein
MLRELEPRLLPTTRGQNSRLRHETTERSTFLFATPAKIGRTRCFLLCLGRRRNSREQLLQLPDAPVDLSRRLATRLLLADRKSPKLLPQNLLDTFSFRSRGFYRISENGTTLGGTTL